MGNRAVITASTSKTEGQGIYLHWNGGIESVLAFLDTARQLKYRDPNLDNSYGMARLCGLICLMLDIRSSTGVGIGELKQLDCDNYDNGVYVIGHDWQIVDRWGQGSVPVARESIEAARASQQYQSMIEHISALLNATETV